MSLDPKPLEILEELPPKAVARLRVLRFIGLVFFGTAFPGSLLAYLTSSDSVTITHLLVMLPPSIGGVAYFYTWPRRWLRRNGASRWSAREQRLVMFYSTKRDKQRPPLRILGALMKALWSAKTYNQVFKPVLADIVFEWKDARRRHEKFRAWWIKNVRGRYAILSVAVLQLPWSAMKKIASILVELSR